MNNLSIKVPYVTRVEGHGNIVVDLKDGKLVKSVLEIVEPPRYFEAMMKGYSYNDAAVISSRICGICSVGHQMTSVKATEKALGFEVTEQAVLLRKLLIYGATMQSHILHIFFLAAPDLFNALSVVPLAKTHPEIVKMALRMKRLSNDICDIIGGRTIHPNRVVPGGFTKLPTEEQLKWIKDKLENQMVPDAKASFELLKSLADKFPAFTRETEYVGLRTDSEYAFYEGDIASTDTGRVPDTEYRTITNEFIVPHSTAKHAKHKRSSYAVGAMARLNNNYDKLNPLAKQVADALGMKPIVTNPFLNTVAQLVETIHVTEESLKIIDNLLSTGIKPERPYVPSKLHEGTGIGCTEVPRGILFHEYTYDNRGRIVKANCVIPTNQNTQNIDDDMKQLVPWMIDNKLDKDKMTLTLEMLVRAYDPCISCSVHFLDVKYIE
ncbi:MAG: Ni/Fe hydrogenase subunit alpha [Spirochaetales bacterium]|nr:Ni/Fe hydrogenase subunit alpha [Spirochaetales bacterium]